MRKMMAILTIAIVLLCGVSAWAGERITLNCIDMPGCCTITCVMIDAKCCGCGSGNGPLLAEFLSPQGDVLGTATFAGNWCCGETYGQLDKPVNSNDVCSIRLVKPQDDCTTVTWASLRVRCGDECSCGKWHKVFKGKLWCWETIPAAPQAVTPPPPPPPPPPAAPPAVEPAPAATPEFAPPPDSETEPEVIVVPGRG